MASLEPTTRLQAVRLALGWKQSRVLAALAAQASSTGVTIAAPASLKTMLSRWENGSGRPDAVYQGLLCRVFDCEPADLGFGPEPGRLALARVTPIADSETVNYFRSVLHQHIRADNLIGPHHLIDVVTAQAALLDCTLTDLPGGRVREQLLGLAYQYNELAGWLLQDAGDPDRAMALSDRAMERALVLEDRPSTVYILTRKSNIASDQGNPDRALAIAEAAVRLMGSVSPQMKAVVLSHQARAQALRGAAGDSAQSMESAAEEINRHEGDPDPLAAYVTPQYVAMESAACWMTLGRSDRAIPIPAGPDHLAGPPQTRSRAMPGPTRHGVRRPGRDRYRRRGRRPGRGDHPGRDLGPRDSPTGRPARETVVQKAQQPPGRRPSSNDQQPSARRLRHNASVNHVLTSATAKDERERDADVALLPIGSFEQHGDYLPLTTDTLVACAIANEIARSRRAFVLAPVAISCSHEHVAWRGTASISARTLYQLVADIADSVRASSVSHVALVNAHGGNYVLSNIVQEYTATHGPVMSLFPRSSHWTEARHAAGLETDQHTDMHAGELEVSILLATTPEVVRDGYETSDWTADDRPDLLTLGMSAYTKTGVIGRPSLGTAAKGERLLAALASLFTVPSSNP